MKERPIILKPWEVRAFLDGRKTQIRRLMSPQPIGRYQGCAPAREFLGSRHIGKFGAYFAGGGFIPCPFGKPGDVLWGKETWQCHDDTLGFKSVYCKATSSDFDTQALSWRSPVSMPRWASRIYLTVVSVRVERLQDISEEDARAEGADYEVVASHAPGCDGFCNKCPAATQSWVASFKQIWQSTYGPDSWDANDWVWVADVNQYN